MTIRLLDYAAKETVVDIGNLEDIARMSIDVVTGDEILTVIYKDYTERRFDSACDRRRDYYDGGYEVYDFLHPESSLLSNPRFMGRVSSYAFYYDFEADDEES